MNHMNKLYQVTDTNTDLQGQGDGFSVGDKDGEGVWTEVLSEGSEWFQSLHADLESEPKNQSREREQLIYRQKCVGKFKAQTGCMI